MDNFYGKLTEYSPLLIEEKKQQYHYISERHIQVMWFEQKYFKNLHTVDGKRVEVVSPGIWNLGAGPDFLKAHLQVGGVEIKGDIEIHLSEEDWGNHGHDQDERYENVILHLFLWRSRRAISIQTKQGTAIRAVDLEKYLTISLQRITQLIDLELYPYKHFVGSGKCARNLFRKLSETEVAWFFEQAAIWRLFKKGEFLKARFHDRSECVWAGIAMAMGYKHNADFFLALYQKIQGLEATKETLLSLMMGWCGFFTPIYQKKWEGSIVYRQLEKMFRKLESPDEGCISLHLHQVRPLNHPIRRLAALAILLEAGKRNCPYLPFSRAWKKAWNTTIPNAKLKNSFDEQFPKIEDAYWNRRFLFETEPRETHLPLSGKELRHRIFVNTILPFLYEEIVLRGDKGEIDRFHEFFSSLPAEKNSKTKYLQHRLFGSSPNGSVLQKGAMEQGAYQLHSDFCLHYEASCQGCPFVERYHTIAAAFR